jgi:LPS-assembly protein
MLVLPLVFLLSLMNAAAFAADTPTVKKTSPPTTTKPVERKQKKLPIKLEADRIEGRTGREVEASGSVKMQQGDLKLNTKELYFLEPEQEVTATGDVRFEKGGDIVEGDFLRYDLDTDTGHMDRPQFRLVKKADRKRGGRGDARRIDFLGANRERLSDSRYTTCAPGQDDWFLRVKDLELDRITEVGTARNASVEFMGVPFLYLPWVSFPLSDKRKTGLLPPVIGTSDSSGLEISVPYYWNIAPNMDATITPRVLSKRGLQIQNEFRYLWPTFAGELNGDILPSDRETGTNRDFLAWRHDHNFTRGWTGRLNVQRVSDDNYFRDLSTRVVDTSSTNLPRDAELRYSADIWTFSARALSYQTLQDPDPAKRIDTPYRLKPQLTLRGLKTDYFGADLNLESELTEFGHPSKVNGQRFLIYPNVSYPIVNNFSFLTPKLGYHYTRYRLTENVSGNESIDRGLPIFSIDSGLFFERQFDFKRRPYVQTLEPRLYYAYIPFREQSLIPNFSTTEADFNFAQIFTENQFIGGDRINDANQLTAAVTSRFIENETGIERLRAAVGQRYYFEKQRVTLDNPARDGNASDILAAVSGQLSRKWSVDVALQYSPDANRSEKLSIATRYNPAPGKVISLAYRSRVGTPSLPDPINQIDLSGQWPFGARWYGLGRLNYSLRDRTIVEGLAGVEYNANCWALRLVAHRLATAQQQVSTSLFFQLELTGLSRLGNNPLELLKQSIPGYRTSQEIAP